MTQEAAVPRDLWGRIQKMIDDAVAASQRSGPTRNSSITEGRLTVAGGAVVVQAADGDTSAYWGPIFPAMPDGTLQPGWIMYREDGSLAAAMYDPTPDPTVDGGYQQFLALYDRSGKIVVSDDTFSGDGLARPYVPIPVTRARYTDMIAVTDTEFVTVIETPGLVHKVNARTRVDIRCTSDVSDTTGEVRVLVDGVQVGTTQNVTFRVQTLPVGPFVMPGKAYSTHQIKVQARRTAGTGAIRLDAAVWGVQS